MSADQEKPKMSPEASLRRVITAMAYNDIHAALHGRQVACEMLAKIVGCCEKAIEQGGALDPRSLLAFITDNAGQLDPATAEKVGQQ